MLLDFVPNRGNGRDNLVEGITELATLCKGAKYYKD